MITIIRKRLIESKAYKLIVWSMVIILASSLGLPGLMKQSGNDRWIATINGHDVNYADYVRQIAHQEYFIQLFRRQYGSYADNLLQAMGFSSDPQTLALQTVIRNELLNQAADSMGISVHHDFLEEKLSDPLFIQQELTDVVPPSIVDAHGINREQLKKYLQQAHMSIADFEESALKALQRSIVKEIIYSASYIPTFETNNLYSLEFAPKKFALVTFTLDRFLNEAHKTAISTTELEAFFEQQNKQTQRYSVPEKRKGKVWKFDASLFCKEIGNEEINSYYHMHKKNKFVASPATIELRRILFAVSGKQDTQEIYKKAQMVHDQLVKDPTLFKQKAQEFSDDKKTAAAGGLISAFKRGTQEPAFEKAAFMLKQDGDISEVIQTSEGFQIVQRVRKTMPVYKKIEDVIVEIREALLSEQFNGDFAKSMDSCIGRTLNIDVLQTLISSKKAKMTEVPFVAQEKSKTHDLLFNLAEKTYGYYIDGMYGYVVYLSDIAPRFVPTLASIKNRVEQDYYQDKAHQLMINALHEARNALAHKSLQDISKEFNAPLSNTQLIGKQDTGALAELRARGLPVEKMLQMEKKGLAITHEASRNGFLIVVDEIASPDQVLLEKNKLELSQELMREKSRLSMVGFVASLHRNATIKQNDSLLNA